MSPKLPSLTPKEVATALRRAGFTHERQQGSHLNLTRPGDKLRVTVPMHSRALDKGMAHAIIKQAKLTVGDFLGFL